MKIIDYVEKIDEILSSYEDWMKGRDGEDCTNARVYLNEIRKQCHIADVVNCLPKKEDVSSELENHLDKWSKSHSKQTNDAYALGFRHCFHYISDWIKQHR